MTTAIRVLTPAPSHWRRALCQQLARIGVWPALRDCATPIAQVHVSDRGHAGFVNLQAQDYQVDALGQVIELHDAGQRLFALLAKAPGVTLHCPARVVDVIRTAERAEVQLDTGLRLCGQLLVAADGSRSALAQACKRAVAAGGLSAVRHHRQRHHGGRSAGRAFERFTRYGPLALLPMSQGAVLWWEPCARRSRPGGCLGRRAFYRRAATGLRLAAGRILKAGKRHSYPLSLLTADRHVSHRLALVGNAAQTLYPIAGQGSTSVCAT